MHLANPTSIVATRAYVAAITLRTIHAPLRIIGFPRLDRLSLIASRTIERKHFRQCPELWDRLHELHWLPAIRACRRNELIIWHECILDEQ
jgi:hypothetical protein